MTDPEKTMDLLLQFLEEVTGHSWQVDKESKNDLYEWAREPMPLPEPRVGNSKSHGEGVTKNAGMEGRKPGTNGKCGATVADAVGGDGKRGAP